MRFSKAGSPRRRRHSTSPARGDHRRPTRSLRRTGDNGDDRETNVGGCLRQATNPVAIRRIAPTLIGWAMSDASQLETFTAGVETAVDVPAIERQLRELWALASESGQGQITRARPFKLDRKHQ